MFLLNERLDTSVELEGIEYELNMSFGNVLDALESLSDRDMNESDRIEVCLEILLEDEYSTLDLDINNQVSLLQKCLEIINSETIESGEVDLNGDLIVKTKSKNQSPELISFTQDAKYIYAAFMQTYGIDLIEVQNSLHWIKFSAMLNALPDNTLMRQIIDIRQTDLKEIKDKKEKSRIKKLQKQFKIIGSVDVNEGGEEGEYYE